MCDKNKKISLQDSLDLINTCLPILLEQAQEECINCRQPCEEEDENSSWQYFPNDGYKYCYDCWEELELESQL